MGSTEPATGTWGKVWGQWCCKVILCPFFRPKGGPAIRGDASCVLVTPGFQGTVSSGEAQGHVGVFTSA